MSHPATPEKTSFVLPPASGWHRAVRFLRRPWLHQYYSLALRVQAEFPAFRFPIRLSFGASYLVGNSEVDHRILFGDFELAETQFMQRYLRPGMTVLDIGAHHGYYSLLAAAAVGSRGAVHSFEPSPREFAQLNRNVARNRCSNVSIHNVALGPDEGRVTLYEASGCHDGFNSLRRQESIKDVSPVEVSMVALDQFLKERAICSVDFIKMDVEGAELSIFEGASQLLVAESRPVVLAEVSDLRTKAWGYRAKEILSHLLDRGYEWHSLTGSGSLRPLVNVADSVDGNYVAWPEERCRDLLMD
jgi:FkbM family methyltransferase